MATDDYDSDLERGLRNRRAILGDPWVDRSLGNATAFNAEFQNFITRYAWHEIWGRPGLDPKTRRVIVLAITVALGRWEEYELHLRAALTGAGDTKLAADEVKEVLMQAAIYAGVPAANTAFALAQKVLREIDAAPESGDVLRAEHPGVGHGGHTDSRPRLYFTVREPRDSTQPLHTVVLSHALGCDLSMWDDLANRLARTCRVICYDHRGHGDSQAPEGPYGIADLADDAARLLQELNADPVVWIGLSMGGMVGQEFALRHRVRVKALVIANSTSGYPPAALDLWRQRIEAVQRGGMEAIADGVMERYFHAGFRAAQPATVARFRRRLTTTDPAAYVACCHAVAGVDTTARLAQLKLAALIIAGELDQGAPVAMSQTIAQQLTGARLVVLKDASHLSATEQPEPFAAAVEEFVAALPA